MRYVTYDCFKSLCTCLYLFFLIQQVSSTDFITEFKTGTFFSKYNWHGYKDNEFNLCEFVWHSIYINSDMIKNLYGCTGDVKLL